MTQQEIDQKKAEWYGLMTQAVREVLGEMSQTPSPESFPTRENIQTWIAEALGPQRQDESETETRPETEAEAAAPHHLCDCQDKDCDTCADSLDHAFKNGVAEANQYYEKIPGVTQLREQYVIARQTVNIVGGES